METKKINKFTYVTYASGLYHGYLRKFAIEVDRIDGITVAMQGYGKITDIEFISEERLQAAFEYLEQMELPTQRTYTAAITDGDRWELNIEGVEYSGYFRRPDFLKDILSIIDYASIRKKFGDAYEQYCIAKEKVK